MRYLQFALILAAPLLGQAPGPDTGAPLPSLETVLQGLEANMAAARPMMDRYCHTERMTQRMLDDKGVVTETETKEYEVTSIHGTNIRRLVKVNGKSLSEKQALKEDARVVKAAEQADARAGLQQVELRSLMKFWEITSLRRGAFKDTPTLILEFKPRAGVKVHGKSEEMASKLSGTVHLEARSLEVVHLDARLLAPVRMGWGLASVSEGSTLTQNFQRVNGELTVPQQMVARLSARVLFGHVQVEIATEALDFKKFDVGGGTVTDVQWLPKAK